MKEMLYAAMKGEEVDATYANIGIEKTDWHSEHLHALEEWMDNKGIKRPSSEAIPPAGRQKLDGEQMELDELKHMIEATNYTQKGIMNILEKQEADTTLQTILIKHRLAKMKDFYTLVINMINQISKLK